MNDIINFNPKLEEVLHEERDPEEVASLLESHLRMKLANLAELLATESVDLPQKNVSFGTYARARLVLIHYWDKLPNYQSLTERYNQLDRAIGALEIATFEVDEKDDKNT